MTASGNGHASRKDPQSSPIPTHVPRETSSDREEFLARISSLENSLPANALDLLDRYLALLYEQIPSLSLVAKSDRDTLYTRHLLDSLNPIALFPTPPECALDIGSGGGLPGIPLAAIWPETQVVLLEAREKKAAFLERAVRTLGLKNVRVACERLEEHARKGEPRYDALFIRAVAEPYRLVDEVAPRCRPGAVWVYFAGDGVDRERIATELAHSGRTAFETTGSFGGRLLHGAV